MLQWFALIVLVVVLAAAVVLAIVLGALPGRIARSRNHRQAAAINVCGWLGLLTLGLLWPLAIIWAYTRPFSESEDMNDVRQRLDALEKRVGNGRSDGGGDPP